MNESKQKKNKPKIPKAKIISTISFFCVLIVLTVSVYLFQGGCEKQKNYSNETIEKTIYSDYLNDLKVHMVDVGQGDSIIIQLPNGQYFLIDSGPASDSNNLFKYLDEVLKISKIDYVLATHPDSDHIGAMYNLFKRYEIGYVFRPYVYFDNFEQQYDFPDGFNLGTSPYNSVASTNAYFNFLKAIIEEGCGWEFFNYSSDLTINVKLNNSQNAVCSLDFLTPFQDISDELYFESTNNYSPIILLSFLDKKFLFTGDVDSDLEKIFIDETIAMDLDVDVLKVSHHGSNSSSSTNFLRVVSCEYALISCGKNNSYKHPNKETLSNLLNICNAIVYRTDLNGNIVVTVSREGEISIYTEKTALFDEIFTAP